MDALRSEKKVLVPCDNMGHVVAGTVSPVANENIRSVRQQGMRVSKRAESSEFILIMYWLQEDIGISIGIQVIKGIDMDAKNPLAEWPSETK